MIDQSMEAQLAIIGVHTHRGERPEFDPAGADRMGYPALTLWGSSDPPLPDELIVLAKMVVAIFTRSGKTAGPHLRRFGIDPVMARKSDGRWLFRRMSWGQSWEWVPVASLADFAPQSLVSTIS